MDLGFSVAEARQALEATSGDVDKAAAILQAARREREMQNGGRLAYYANEVLRTQRPWNGARGRLPLVTSAPNSSGP